MATEGELQSQQPTLEENKAPSQCLTLTSKPKHERCVHFHSHYKPQIYFNNMGALIRACKLQRQTVSVAFQRQSESVWWYSNVVRFWGISEESMVSWRLWSQATMTECKLPPLTTSTTAHPLSFFTVLAQGWNNFAQHGLGSPKSLTDASGGEEAWGCYCFFKTDIQVPFRPEPPIPPANGKMYLKVPTHRAVVCFSLIVYSISFLGTKNHHFKVLIYAFSKWYTGHSSVIIWLRIQFQNDTKFMEQSTPLFLHILCLINFMQHPLMSSSEKYICTSKAKYKFLHSVMSVILWKIKHYKMFIRIINGTRHLHTNLQ